MISLETFRRLVRLNGARSTDYRLCFGSPAGQRVLMDLAPYCAAADPLVVTDPDNGPVDVPRTMMLIGRHQVFQRINNHLHLTPEQLYALYDGRAVDQLGDHNA
jgi:hypothetical protein